MSKRQLVVVTWNDAVHHMDGESEPRHRPMIMQTAGWMLKSDRKGVSIAGELASDGTWRAENFIPRGMIVNIRRIK